jgi:hypothetical protein
MDLADSGADLLGLPLLPQGYEVASVMEARRSPDEYLYSEVGVQEPRRASKTTAIWSVLIGRCLAYDDYRVVTTAQDGSRAGEKICEHMELLDQRGFHNRGFGTLYWSNGKQRIKFANGSLIWVVAPKPGAFRSAGADVILFDEAGELDADKGPALLAGALPLMDTRFNPQVIIAGTPGRSRAGLLWETLQRGRSGMPGVGLIDYSLRDDEVLVSFDEDGQRVLHEDVLQRVHPGIGTLTTLARMRDRFTRMQTTGFEMEYGCRWPSSFSSWAIDPDRWTASEIAPMVRPERVGIAYDVAYDGSSASIAYAWRDADGVAYVEVVAHRLGSSWVASEAQKASERFRRIPIAYDNIGANLDPAQVLTRMKPQPRTNALMLKEIMASAQRLVSNLNDGRLRHFGQVDLDAAVGNTSWRDIAKSGRAFGPINPAGAAINPIVAAAEALWSYDKGKDRTALEIAA